MKTLFIILTNLLLALSAFAQQGDLTITLENPGEKKGKAYVGVFTEQSFLMNPIESGMIDLDENQTQVTIKDVEHGTYAVSIFHDANGNGQLDMDEYGRPTEPWGLSGKSTGMMPMWAEAKFELNSDAKEIKIKM